MNLYETIEEMKRHSVVFDIEANMQKFIDENPLEINVESCKNKELVKFVENNKKDIVRQIRSSFYDYLINGSVKI